MADDAIEFDEERVEGTGTNVGIQLSLSTREEAFSSATLIPGAVSTIIEGESYLCLEFLWVAVRIRDVMTELGP